MSAAQADATSHLTGADRDDLPGFVRFCSQQGFLWCDVCETGTVRRRVLPFWARSGAWETTQRTKLMVAPRPTPPCHRMAPDADAAAKAAKALKKAAKAERKNADKVSQATCYLSDALAHHRFPLEVRS